MSDLSPELSERITLGSKLIGEQVDFFRSSFSSVDSEWKKDASRVTEADYRISERVLAGVRGLFPEDDLCSEESVGEGRRELGARFAWVLDPVDGTNNFAIGLPNCAISLALLEDGYPVYGWVYDFAGNRMIHGGAGRGLFEGDRPIQPRRPDVGEETPIGVQFPISETEVQTLMPLFSRERIRALGSGTMEGVYVALGYLGGAVDFRVKVWDIAAFVAFFREVGIQCHFLDESPFPLRVFDPEMKVSPYLAGSEAFLKRVSPLLDAEE